MASTSNIKSEVFVEPIRKSSRQLVRELGFMSSSLAGTRYPPSSVHALIEIGTGNATTATQLCNTLNLEKPNIKHTLHCLIDAGEIQETSNEQDGGEMLLSLTPK